MTQKQINKILKTHGIKIEFITGNLMVLDEFTVNGELQGMWVNAPNTEDRLQEFLNYR